MKTENLSTISLRSWLYVLFAIIVVCALWLVGITPITFIVALFWPAVVLLVLLTISAQFRAIPLRKIKLMILSGMIVVPVLAVILTGLLSFFSMGVLSGTIFSSILIEILIIAPAIMLLFVIQDGDWSKFSGPLDAALLGAGCGAGFEFIENLITRAPWGTVPEWYGGSSSVLWMGHGAVTAFVGLTVGYGLYFQNKTKLWWVLPGAGMLWAIIEHYSAVSFLYIGSDSLLSPLLLLFNGWLLLIVFIIGFFLSLYLADSTLKWYLQLDTQSKTDESFIKIISSPHDKRGDVFNKIVNYEQFRRVRQINAYGLQNFENKVLKTDPKSVFSLYLLQYYLKISRENLSNIP